MFLLSIGDFYLPYSKTHSSEFSYILTKDDAERSLKASNLPHSYINLLPLLQKRNTAVDTSRYIFGMKDDYIDRYILIISKMGESNFNWMHTTMCKSHSISRTTILIFDLEMAIEPTV